MSLKFGMIHKFLLEYQSYNQQRSLNTEMYTFWYKGRKNELDAFGHSLSRKKQQF